MSLSTDDILRLSLELVGWDEVPGDTAVYVPAADIETALVGIDVGSAELQLAHDRGYDLALAHHPAGDDARLNFVEVLDTQVEFMVDHGVPRERAETAVEDLRRNAAHGAHAANYRHDPSVAELLDQPFMNVHLPPDELGRRAFVEVVEELPADATVAELGRAFEVAFPELREAGTDVECRVGRVDSEIGEVAVHHAAGTNGGAPVARAYFEHGVDTVVYIHVDGSATKDLREEFGDEKNLVVTGHIASDAVGMNELVAALEERGVECTRFSGLTLGMEAGA